MYNENLKRMRSSGHYAIAEKKIANEITGLLIKQMVSTLF